MSDSYDVYILAGQSNMDGRGITAELTGPLESYAPQPAPQPTPVALIKVSRGGTNLHSDWNPSLPGGMYKAFLANVPAALAALAATGAAYQVRALFWHQGEGDEDPAHSRAYAGRLIEFMAAVRRDLGLADLPFFIGELNHANPNYVQVRQAQRRVCETAANAIFVLADGLGTRSDLAHFETPGVIELGRRFATAVPWERRTESKPSPSQTCRRAGCPQARGRLSVFCDEHHL